MNIVLNSPVVICDSEKKNDEYVETSTKYLKLEAKFVKKNNAYNELSKRDNDNPDRVKLGIEEIETINIELEHSVAKVLSENEKLHKEIVHLKYTYKELYNSIKPARVHAKEQCDALIINLNSKSVENADLKAQIQKKVFANATLKNELRKFKGKDMRVMVVSKPNATTIAPGMYKLEIGPLPPKVLNNKYAHIAYINHSRDHVENLRDLVKSARALSPLDSNLDSACIGVICSNDASGSMPTRNTRNNRISQPSSSNKINKVEDESRKNKKNHVAKTECNADVMQSMLNANSKYVYVICNECLFDANHDKCVLDYIHDVNVFKSKPATRRTFSIVENKCPLTRFTTIKVVPLKETTIKLVFTPTQGIKVYSRRPKAPKTIGLSSKSIIKESRIYNQSKPTHSRESTVSNVPSSSLIDCRPIHVESINRKKYILVIVDDYSWFTWVNFLRSKDEAPEFIIKFMKMIQVHLNATVKNIRTDNGTKFVNQTLHSYYEDFEAVATTCYTQNCSLIRIYYGKTPYELLHDRKPDLSYLYVFGALCYPTNDSEDLGKLKAKADVSIFISYAPTKKAYRIYNRRPGPQLMTPGTISSGLIPQPLSPTPNSFTSVTSAIPVVVAPVPANSTGTPSSNSIYQDAPSPSTSQTPQESPSYVIPSGAEEADYDIEVAHMDNHPYVDIPILEPSSKESSSQLKKAIYELKQAPRAWYDMLSSFLLSQKFSKGTVDPTLFIRREGKDILSVQIYVDDIIFASTKPDLF
ncbi:uncharacterized mitochondrial protein-like protein [Tanacetum coccineum]|uniref:Uncharacterized mitochondrial protein-like protein n=1 Tax=Tanacetum coccineum TaxID=301880 RepID=A0ABQ4XD27_9ASTR